MELGGYAGNYWAPADGYQIGGRTAAQQRQAADRLGAHESALAALKNGSSADFSADTSLIGALDGIRNDLLGQEGQGINLFADNYYLKPYMAAHRRLVLWADLACQQVDYAQVRRSDASTFFRTMAADTLSYAVREHESTPLNFADWMPKASPGLATSDSWETIEVTIAQTDGRTAIGRGAAPRQARPCRCRSWMPRMRHWRCGWAISAHAAILWRRKTTPDHAFRMGTRPA